MYQHSVAMWAVGGQGYRLEDEWASKPVVSMGLTGVIGSFCHGHAFWLGKKMPVRDLVPKCQHVQTASYNLQTIIGVAKKLEENRGC